MSDLLLTKKYNPSVLIFLLLFTQCGNHGEQQRLIGPNVLLILTDDQGYGDLSLHGNPDINTPVLDALAMESAQFDRFYVSPLCAPTRASLLTGRYHLRTGTISVSKGMEIMESSEVTITEVFKANGYKTGIFGKWHNGQHMPNHPNGQGFDEFFGFCGGHWSNYFDTELEHNGEKIKTSGYITDVLTDKALTFIEDNKDSTFFCYVPFNAPHSPHQVPDEYFDKYKAMGLDDELASIYGMVENLDVNIGRLLKKLEDLDLAEETIVIFLTDNGPNGIRYNGNMKGIKGSVDDGGVRVPCFWRWNGHINPSKVSVPGAHIDILPTLVDLCELNMIPTKPLDGVSLAQAIRGQKQILDRMLFSHVAQPQLPVKPYPASVRKFPYALIVQGESSKLYNIAVDPTQESDVTQQNPEVSAQLYDAYQNWFGEVSRELLPIPLIPISPAVKIIELPTYESTFGGNLRYKEGHGWVHDWLVNWISTWDSISWEIESPKDQQFLVYLNYTCPEGQQGSTVDITVGSKTISQQIYESYDPEYIVSPDRVRRKEAYEKTWKRLAMGQVHIPEGRSRVVITAPVIANTEVAEIKSIELVRN
jgi:arylsulfatase A